MLQIWVIEEDKNFSQGLMKMLKEYISAKKRDSDWSIALNVIDEDYLNDVDDILQADHKGGNLFILSIDLHREYNGIQLAERIRKKDKQSNIIFVSSHIELEDKIFTHNLKVITFIGKEDPYFKQRLISAIDFALVERAEIEKESSVNELESNILKYHYKGHYYLIPYDEIISVETNAVKRGLVIHTDRREYPCRKSMKEIMALLPNEFIQVHRSIAVNAFRIQEVMKDESVYTVMMDDESLYPASHSGFELITEYVKNH